MKENDEYLDFLYSSIMESQNSIFVVFDYKGNLIFSNFGFKKFLDKYNIKDNPTSLFLTPEFKYFQNKMDNITGNVSFEILNITLGNEKEPYLSLISKIKIEPHRVTIFGEINIDEIISINKEFILLNNEVQTLNRLVIKKEKELEIALQKLKDTQTMLIQSEKMNALGYLVAGISHEINNPLSYINSNFKALENYFIDIEKIFTENKSLLSDIIKKYDIDFMMNDIKEIFKSNYNGLKRIIEIIINLKYFAHHNEAEFKMADINEELKRTLTIANFEIQKNKINLILDLRDIPEIFCNPSLLNQAFLNIIINAIQAIKENGIITISTENSEKYIKITIKDNGCGIPEQNINKIFDPFWTTKPVGTGTGMGLSIVYKIIKDIHKGEIEVYSKVNEGTSFIISLKKDLKNEL